MRGLLLLVTAAIAYAVPASSARAATAPDGAGSPTAVPRYTAAQFYDTTSYAPGSASGSLFTRDGSHLLVNSNANGTWNAYLMAADGSGPPIRLTHSTAAPHIGITFIPGSDRLLYTADGSGDELSHLFVREEDGSVRDLTPGEGHRASFYGFAGDDRTFYVATNERDPQYMDVYAYDANGYQRTLLFENEGYTPGSISDDGRWLVLGKTHSSADSDLYLVDLASADKTPRLISAHEGNVTHGAMGFTPDSARLLYSTDAHGEFTQAWSYDLAAGTHEKMLEADWDVAGFGYSDSGRYRYSVVNADGLAEVRVLDTTTGKDVAFDGLPEGNLGAFRFNADETIAVFTLGSDTSPSDIYVADMASGETRRLTKSLTPQIDEKHLVNASVARFASWDGLEVPGILYRPHGASADNPAPAVVFVHGGPGGQSTRGYSPTIQHLVNHGYAVYAINNRGSSGYGKTFFHLDDQRHGEHDLDDVVASKAYLQSLDWVADDRIAIMGGSYGGYMVAAALAFRPEVFDAGINIYGVTNWVRTLKSIPPWWGANRARLYDEMGDPEKDEERLTRISPLFHAANIVRPMLVMQGANDPRVLQIESDELVAAARGNGAEVDYVIFPDEGHGFQRTENKIRASEAYLAFLDKHVGSR